MLKHSSHDPEDQGSKDQIFTPLSVPALSLDA